MFSDFAKALGGKSGRAEVPATAAGRELRPIWRELRSSRDACRTIRNPGTLVRIKYARNALALSEWVVASRISKPARAGKGEGGGEGGGEDGAATLTPPPGA